MKFLCSLDCGKAAECWGRREVLSCTVLHETRTLLDGEHSISAVMPSHFYHTSRKVQINTTLESWRARAAAAQSAQATQYIVQDGICRGLLAAAGVQCLKLPYLDQHTNNRADNRANIILRDILCWKIRYWEHLLKLVIEILRETVREVRRLSNTRT